MVDPPPNATPLDTRALLDVLAAHDVECVIVGGIAVQAHGYLRATADVDLIPGPQLANLSRLAEALVELEARAFATRKRFDVSDPQLLRRAQLVPLMTRHGRLDLLNIETSEGTPRSYDGLRERALVVELRGLRVVVAGADDLIRMKRAAGREHDLQDIAVLSRTDDELEQEAQDERKGEESDG